MHARVLLIHYLSIIPFTSYKDISLKVWVKLVKNEPSVVPVVLTAVIFQNSKGQRAAREIFCNYVIYRTTLATFYLLLTNLNLDILLLFRSKLELNITERGAREGQRRKK